ncbi:MAG: N-acylneuraminate cytidylyltransferase [Parcubacteria group bacterium]|nr:N-acylneuraminate cytidylyltransferase [Parcubacteria group bacterium]
MHSGILTATLTKGRKKSSITEILDTLFLILDTYFMYKNKRFFAVIPARGGSKGIPRKNIKECAGKPLIQWTIEAAKKSALLDRFVVSTDDEEIGRIATACGADMPFVRPEELSTDSARGIDVAAHALQWANEESGPYDYCLILQPTSPLRSVEDIDECIRKAVDTNADSVMSMYEISDMSPRKFKRIVNDKILPMAADEGATTADRHDSEPIYKRNCAVYLTKAEVMLRGELFGDDSRPYIMPADRSIDINETLDFKFAEFLLSERRSKKGADQQQVKSKA